MFGNYPLSLSLPTRVTTDCSCELCPIAIVSVRYRPPVRAGSLRVVLRFTNAISPIVAVTFPLPAIHSLTRDCRLTLGLQKWYPPSPLGLDQSPTCQNEL